MLIFLAAILPLVQDPQPPRFPDFPEQDAVRYDLDLTLDLEKRRLEGRIRYWAWVLSFGPDKSIPALVRE